MLLLRKWHCRIRRNSDIGPCFGTHRTDLNQPEARIVLTSGYTKDAVVRQSFLRDGEGFIEKPFTAAKLALKAREVLDSSNGDHRG